jgi:hypothetical protein
MKKKLFFKYNEDDILEILTEYLAKENRFKKFFARAEILGSPGSDLRLVAVIGDSEDSSINDIDLKAIDKENKYNGPHTNNIYIKNINKFKNMKIDDC